MTAAHRPLVPASAAGRSLFWFAVCWVLPNGLLLLVAPALPLKLLELAVEGTTWLRIMGMLICIFAYYYVNLSRQENREFFRWTIQTRAAVPLVFAGFVVAGMDPLLMVFALGDLAGAIWTLWAVRHDATAARVASM